MKRDCKCFTPRWVVFRNTFKVNLGKRGAETEFFSKVSEETLGENSKTDIKSIYGKHKCREKNTIQTVSLLPDSLILLQ